MKRPFHLELNEEPHVYLREGKPLFAGRPDHVRCYPKLGLTIVLDRKFGRAEVPSADVNMQLRCYMLMTDAELEFEPTEPEFRPSSLLRLKLCPGSLALERNMTAKGLSDGEPSEDAAEGSRLHKAISEPLAPRDDLKPEQLEIVEKAERMEREVIDFVLSCELTVSGGAPYYGAIIQPRTSRKADVAFYTEDDLLKARSEIDGIWDTAHQEGAQRRASADACKFCPCKPICPEYKAWLGEVEKIQHLPAATWTPEMWETFLSRRRELEKFLEDRYKDAKAIVAANPDAIPGWELKPGDMVRHVNDLPAAWTALNGTIDAKQFSGACKVSLGEIEEIIWDARKNTSAKITQKEAKAIVNSKLTGLIEYRQKAPSLVRKK